MMDRAFGGNRLTSKGEIATRAMFVAAEKSFRKSRKPGTEKRRNEMMLVQEYGILPHSRTYYCLLFSLYHMFIVFVISY